MRVIQTGKRREVSTSMEGGRHGVPRKWHNLWLGASSFGLGAVVADR